MRSCDDASMGIGAVAILKIRSLRPPKRAHATPLRVIHKLDCSLLHTKDSFDDLPADEHGLALRTLLGKRLDAHDDPRGILFFPDVYEPLAATYDELVVEIDDGGFWAPLVDAAHVPERISTPELGTVEEMIAEALRVMGPRGRELVEMAQARYPLATLPRRAATATERRDDEYGALVAPLRRAMGKDFVRELESRFDELIASSVETEGR